MAVCAISVLVPSQGSERALKTSKMDFYYECYFLVHLVSRVERTLSYFVCQGSFHLDWLHGPAGQVAARYCSYPPPHPHSSQEGGHMTQAGQL